MFETICGHRPTFYPTKNHACLNHSSC